MACTVYRTNHKTGATYAYSQESYRDPVTKRPRNKKTYLGRVDPVTHMIIPKGDRSNHSTATLNSEKFDEYIPREVAELIKQQQEQIKSLKEEVDIQGKRIQMLVRGLEQVNQITNHLTAQE